MLQTALPHTEYTPDSRDWSARVERVAAIAALHADVVDQEGRFPHESVSAMRAEGLLGAWIPVELGGLGCSLHDMAEACEKLGQHCATSGMIFAMHQIEIISLLRHSGTSGFLRNYLCTAARDQRLIASATSEIGVGGDLRSSKCALVSGPNGLSLEKYSPVISYGNEADDILATARRDADANASDQVAVLLSRDGYRLEQTATWNALGFRGTCSHGFTLHAMGIDPDAVLPVHFATVAAETMVPMSHLLWGSLWLGMATDAVRRARLAVRLNTKRTGGVPQSGNSRLAELVAQLHELRAMIHDAVNEYVAHESDADYLQSMSFAIRINNVKLSASNAVVEIARGALCVSGITGYRLDSPVSMGRALRDAFGAVIMISNDRILAANAMLLLASRED